MQLLTEDTHGYYHQHLDTYDDEFLPLPTMIIKKNVFVSVCYYTDGHDQRQTGLKITGPHQKSFYGCLWKHIQMREILPYTTISTFL
jgi:hypothetical protein